MTNSGWQAAVDLERLTQWMDAQSLESGPIVDAQPLTGGTQNILLRFRRGAREFVLRRPPLHARPEVCATIAREARVLGALAGTAVPHPELFGSCTDDAMLGAPFYLMAPVEGFNASAAALPDFHAQPQAQQRMGYSMVDALLRLESQAWLTGTDEGLFAPLRRDAQFLSVHDGQLASF